MKVDDKVREIISNRLGVKFTDTTPHVLLMEDLDCDSLDKVELVVELEEEFDIEIPDEASERMHSVGDVVRYVEEKVK